MNNKIKIGLGIFIVISIILIVLKLKGEFLTSDPTSTCTQIDASGPNRENFLNNVVATFASPRDLNPSYFSIDDILKQKITEDIKTKVENRLRDNVNKYLNKLIEDSPKIKNMIDTYKTERINEIPLKLPQLIKRDDTFVITLGYNQAAHLYRREGVREDADFSHNKKSDMKWAGEESWR